VDLRYIRERLEKRYDPYAYKEIEFVNITLSKTTEEAWKTAWAVQQKRYARLTNMLKLMPFSFFFFLFFESNFITRLVHSVLSMKLAVNYLDTHPIPVHCRIKNINCVNPPTLILHLDDT
jgi:hypothetical protein